jgi:hypothetical protein
MTQALTADKQVTTRAYALYTESDRLAGSPSDDPRIPALARAVADSMPQGLAQAAAGAAARPTAGGGTGFAEAFFADDGSADLPVGGQTTIAVEPAEPVRLVRPLGGEARARVLRLHADDPAPAVAALAAGPHRTEDVTSG